MAKTRAEITRQTTETARSNREKRERQRLRDEAYRLGVGYTPEQLDLIINDVGMFSETYRTVYTGPIILSDMLRLFIQSVAVPNTYTPMDTLYAGLLISVTPGVLDCIHDVLDDVVIELAIVEGVEGVRND